MQKAGQGRTNPAPAQHTCAVRASRSRLAARRPKRATQTPRVAAELLERFTVAKHPVAGPMPLHSEISGEGVRYGLRASGAGCASSTSSRRRSRRSRAGSSSTRPRASDCLNLMQVCSNVVGGVDRRSRDRRLRQCCSYVKVGVVLRVLGMSLGVSAGTKRRGERGELGGAARRAALLTARDQQSTDALVFAVTA
jgi:hypothetical protein